jgi:ribonuclease P/MRP protein subunit RPP40
MSAAKDEDAEDFEARVTAIHEWIGLVSLESPRVEVDDDIDSFLSRYSKPEDSHGSELVVITVHGLLPARLVQDYFFALL